MVAITQEGYFHPLAMSTLVAASIPPQFEEPSGPKCLSEEESDNILVDELEEKMREPMIITGMDLGVPGSEVTVGVVQRFDVKPAKMEFVVFDDPLKEELMNQENEPCQDPNSPSSPRKLDMGAINRAINQAATAVATNAQRVAQPPKYNHKQRRALKAIQRKQIKEAARKLEAHARRQQVKEKKLASASSSPSLLSTTPSETSSG